MANFAQTICIQAICACRKLRGAVGPNFLEQVYDLICGDSNSMIDAYLRQQLTQAESRKLKHTKLTPAFDSNQIPYLSIKHGNGEAIIG